MREWSLRILWCVAGAVAAITLSYVMGQPGCVAEQTPASTSNVTRELHLVPTNGEPLSFPMCRLDNSAVLPFGGWCMTTDEDDSGHLVYIAESGL